MHPGSFKTVRAEIAFSFEADIIRHRKSHILTSPPLKTAQGEPRQLFYDLHRSIPL